MIEAAIFVIFPFAMAFAAVSDMLSMTIANRVSVILVATFLVLAPLTGMDWTTFGWHIAAGMTVLCVTFSLFALGTMGGGDAKLMAATSLWMGFGMPLLEYLTIAALLGGMLTVAILLYRKSPLSIFTGRNMFLRHFADPDVGIPYGVALGVGGLLTYPQTPLVVWAVARMAG